MWMVCYAVDRSDGGGDHKTIVEHPQRACAAPVHLRRHAAAVRVTYQLSWWRDWDAGRHGRRHAWSRVRSLRRHIADRQQQQHRCASVRQQVRYAHSVSAFFLHEFLPYIPYFRAYTPHTHVTRTRLYPAQNRIFSTKKLYSPHCRIPRTGAVMACHPSCPCITHVTAAGGMGGEREVGRSNEPVE